jgi:hypothetical protein
MSIASIPAILIAVPVLYFVFMGLTLLGSGVAAAFMALLFGLMVPQFHVLFTGGRKIFPAIAFFVFIGLMIFGAFASRFNERHPRPDSLMYGLNPDGKTATWISFDRAPDVWTKQLVPAQANEKELPEYFPWTSRKFRVANAPVVPLAPPVVDVLDDETSAGLRTLQLRVRSQRHAPELVVSSLSGDRLREVTVDGSPLGNIEEMALVLRKKDTWGFDFVGLPESGVVLVLQMTPGPIRLTFVDVSYGFPDALTSSMPTRPLVTVAHPIPITDKTYVTLTRMF